MSGKNTTRKNAAPADRRVRKTRQALMEAFIALVLSRRYDAIRVNDIIAAADVGRSTFYEHFRGKDDMLLESMAGIFDGLSHAVGGDGDVKKVERILEHLWSNRRLARQVMIGPSAPLMRPRGVQGFAAFVQARIAASYGRRAARALLPPRLLALHVSEGILGLVRAWIGGAAPCKAGDLAQALRRSAGGSITALLA